MHFGFVIFVVVIVHQCTSFVALTDTTLPQAVTDFAEGSSVQATAIATYGDIEQWDVSRCTTFQDLFVDKDIGSPNLSQWDVSSVANMDGTFRNSNFNGDISTWNVGHCTTMAHMFQTSSFDGDISKWEVSNVETFYWMFFLNSKFTARGGLSKWNVAKVTNMYLMFSGASKFNADISSWNVGKVIVMYEMFDNADSYQETLCSTSWQTSPLASTNRANSGLPTAAGGRLFCCGVGHHLEKHTNSTCRSCPAGYTKGQVNVAHECNICPRNTFSAADSLSKCTSCLNKTFAAPGAKFCSLCPAGWSMSHGSSSTSCNECNIGHYQRLSGSTLCDKCPQGYYQKQKGQSFCPTCSAGSFSQTTANPSCTFCQPGNYQHNSGKTSCKDCPSGYQQPEIGQSYCSSCSPGTFSETTGNPLCTFCQSGMFMPRSQSNGPCLLCGPGRFQVLNQGVTCDACGPGSYSNEDGMKSQSQCKLCPVGKSSVAYGLRAADQCIDCQPGQYMDEEGSSTGECFSCPGGWLQENKGTINCTLVANGAIVLGSGATSVAVPLGSYLSQCNKTSTESTVTCKSFRACPRGFVGTVPPSMLCTACLPGETSNKGALSCSNCNKGRASMSRGSSLCTECLENEFQPQDQTASVQCSHCPIGWNQVNRGQSFCVDLGGLKPIDCKNDEYFNTSTATCIACPRGASCDGPVTQTEVMAKFGWARCPTKTLSLSLTFAECVGHIACLGMPNPVLEGIYFNATMFDLAKLAGVNETCADGHKNPPTTNLRCSTCIDGYALTNGKCIACVEGDSITILAVGGFFSITSFGFLVGMKLRSSGHRKAEHSTIKRTLLSHIQMVSIVLSLNVPWPHAVRISMEFVSNFLSINAAASSVQCGVGGMSMHQFYYGALVSSVLLPFVMVGLTYIYWIVLVPICCRSLSCGIPLKRSSYCPNKYRIHRPVSSDSRSSSAGSKDSVVFVVTTQLELGTINKQIEKKTEKTIRHHKNNKEQHSTRDGWIITMVLMIYLLFPSIVKSSFQMLQCETVW
jgi:surface protein